MGSKAINGISTGRNVANTLWWPVFPVLLTQPAPYIKDKVYLIK